MPVAAKPKLLVCELWGLGDLVIATPFLQAAAEQFDVTLIAKPFAQDLGRLFWPTIEVLPFTAPWTAFLGKYRLWHWPWRELRQLRRQLTTAGFDHAVSARRDPRDHLLLSLSGARERWGFPRFKSGLWLTHSLPRPAAAAHGSENWRLAGQALGLRVQPPAVVIRPPDDRRRTVQFHSGARLPARVWPLENFLALARRLRARGVPVEIICDPGQLAWWQSQGESPACPHTVTQLHAILQRSAAFVGNDSGPGHLAAISGLPTFTVFGPSLLEWFAPVNPQAEVFEGKACPYKPCSDYCRYNTPFCLHDVTVAEVAPRVEAFVDRHVGTAAGRAA